MTETRTLSWERGGRRLLARVEPEGLRRAAGGFFPDLRIEASGEGGPDEAALPPGAVGLRLGERPGPDGVPRFALEVREPAPGGTGSGEFPRAADALRAFELALAEWIALRDGDVLRLHASGAVIGGGAVLLVGASGSGKSTLAAALARRGHPLLGDDLVPVDRETRRASAFPRLLKLEGDGARLLGATPPRGPAAGFWPETSLLHPGDLGSRWGDPAPVRAILFPRRRALPGRRGAGSVAPIRPSEALEILLRERVFPRDPAPDFALLADLLNEMVCTGVLTFEDAPEGVARIETALAG